MALTIVRNDITQMHVDAIVNTTNVRLEVGGLGVDAGIHYAAGPELKEALAKIGTCPVGSAVITNSFEIPFCRYIIHTVGPIYIDGHHGEREDLESCYRSILALAKEKGCRSLAIPSISTGAYGYPKAEAYSIATSCIRDFLLSLPDGEDMMIYIVLYDRESVAVSAKIDSGVQHFISEAYRKNRKEELYSFYEGNSSRARSGKMRPSLGSSLRKGQSYAEEPAFSEDMAAPMLSASEEECPEMQKAASGKYPWDGYEKEDRSFADMCEWWCREKGISKKEFYIRANINKSMFWGMKHHPEQIPKKTSALACVIGLQLDYDQALDLLRRAGMTLSKYYETDLIVEYFIREKNYDIDEINGLLWEKDLSLLGQNTA